MVVGSNHANTLVMAIALEQLLTKKEKAGVGNDVVLQNNPLLLLLKKPIQRRGDPSTAAQVGGLEQGLHIARPIHLRHQLANLLAALGFPWPARTRTITGHIELARLDLSQRAQHPSGALRAVERNQQNGCAETHGANQQ